MTTSERHLIHICEVCDRTEILLPSEAFDAGWDYPPRMGTFGTSSPRTCPECPAIATLWWAVVMDGKTAEELTDRQRQTLTRIAGEPETVLPRP